MYTTIKRAASTSTAAIAMLAIAVGGFGFAIAAATPAAHAAGAVAPTTMAATSVTASDATLNGTNGDATSTDSSFWVSTSPFSTASSAALPSGVYSTPNLGAVNPDTAFSAQLSSVTGLPPVTSGTTYYYAAWTEVNGTWSAGAVLQFSTVSVPTITNISPASGSTVGGDSITITGTGFENGATVTVGGASATNVVVVSPTSITATTPSGTAGAQNVVVTNPDAGTITATGGFTYVTATATVSPTTMPATGITMSDATLGGTNGSSAATDSSVWVSTSSFSTATPTLPSGVYSTPDLGPVAANTAFSSTLSAATGLPAVTPNTTYYYAAWTEVNGTWSPGAVLSFTTASTSVPGAPTVSSVSPSTGTIAGGETVTITGTNFTGATAVDFGLHPAATFTVVNDTTITATTPGRVNPGTLNITVTTPNGVSATNAGDHFSYTAQTGTITGTVGGGTLAVTSITPVQTSATADGTFADGWSYIFNITVPTSEPNLSMSFANWLNTAASSTIPVANNMEISSAQAADTAPVVLTAANAYSSPALDMVGNLSTSTPGLHVQVLVQTAVPIGTVNGSYTTSYNVQTLP